MGPLLGSSSGVSQIQTINLWHAHNIKKLIKCDCRQHVLRVFSSTIRQISNTRFYLQGSGGGGGGGGEEGQASAGGSDSGSILGLVGPLLGSSSGGSGGVSYYDMFLPTLL